MNRMIDFFLPSADEQLAASLIEQLVTRPVVRAVIKQPLESQLSSATLRAIAMQAQAEFTIIVTKATTIVLGL